MTRPGALLLTPGAGSSREHPSLKAIERVVAPLPVARVDFPYRRAGRKAPDRPPVLLQCIADEAATLVGAAHIRANRLALGGRSMGGRMCSMAVADGLASCALVLISYPLHPPGKPTQLRVEHLPRITVPTLIVQGTRDPFGTPDELDAAVATMAAPVTMVWIDGGRHDLKGADEDVASAVATFLRGLR